MFPLYPKSWQRAAVVATIGAIPAVGLCAWPYTVDDAFIVARYASRLAQGQGYTFNAGPPTDGITGPLWLLPGWLAVRAGLDPVLAAKILGLVCSTLGCACIVRRLTRRARGTQMAIVAALLFALQPTAGGWGVAGLETGAATLALCWAALAATRRSCALSLISAELGAAITLLAWLRPELALAAAMLLASTIARFGLRRAAPALALACVGAAMVLVFRLQMFGHAWPLAYYAKQGELSHGADYAARALWVVWGLFGLPLIAWGGLRGRRDDRWIAGSLIVHTIGVVLAGGDWMPGFRLFAPVLPLGLALAGVGAARLSLPSRTGSRARPAIAAGLVVLTLGVFGTDLATRIPEWRASGQSRERQGRALADRLRGAATNVALVDIGYLGFTSGLAVVDLGGITDPEVGLLPGGHLDKRLPSAWLAQRAPDALVLHSARPPLMAANSGLAVLAGYPIEQRVARDAWVQRNFRVALTMEYAPHYHYVLLLRRHAAGD